LPAEPWGEGAETESPLQALPPPEAPAQSPVVNLEEEIPQIDLASEMETAPSAEHEPEEEAASAAPGRGIFNTETLARIYVDQKFYGRAAEIYRQLVQERPGDGELRRKLDEVLDLERTPGGASEETFPSAAPGPAPAVSGGQDETIRRLQRFLDGVKGGRPQ
jgi:hypothetical protein